MAHQAQIRIDFEAAEPVVRQIAAQIRTHIVEGTLAPGEGLPSVRRLATDLAVHFNTVAEAYRMLADEGWLDVSHGRAARVIERLAPKPTERTIGVFRDRLRHMLAEMRASGVTPARIRRELLSAMEVLDK
jgi:DNA-binding transcriptional regulator YhcF (GntR family)